MALCDRVIWGNRDSFIFLISKFRLANCVNCVASGIKNHPSISSQGSLSDAFPSVCLGGLWESQRRNVLFLLKYPLILGQVALL